MAKQVFETVWAGQPLRVEIGQLAQQANGSCLVRFGQTTVLTAAVMADRPGSQDFFPLQVQYQERSYAAGKIPGGFKKREGRPQLAETLAARLIDRAIRPLFPAGMRQEVQVIHTVLSYDPAASPVLAAFLGASLALGISDIPFAGPVAAARLAYDAAGPSLNASAQAVPGSTLDLLLAGSAQALVMLEGEAKELPEAQLLDSLAYGQAELQPLLAFQAEIIAACGQPKRALADGQGTAADLENWLDSQAGPDLEELLREEPYAQAGDRLAAVKDTAWQAWQAEVEDADRAGFDRAFEQVLARVSRRLIVREGLRPDRRGLNELRPLEAQIDFLPQVHGSGLFSRGQTQVLSTLTLAPLDQGPLIDGLQAPYHQRFTQHYNFPAYSVGETGRYGAPGRRELGHGALAERALAQVLPAVEDFPYAIRLVAEVLSSNGSSSQATICAGSLALMAGGVPISGTVAGLAMGLICEDDQAVLLTDIQGLEDHFGDMDFKVAGTARGITALQLDIKLTGLSNDLLAQALDQARQARLEILAVMAQAIPEPRAQVAPTAPAIERLEIPVDKIKRVIGKGGETIDKIIAQTGVTIDIEDDGTTYIYGQDKAANQQALALIQDIIREPVIGEIYDQALVTKLTKYGAFVRLFGHTEAFLHISQVAWERTERMEDALALGDQVRVMLQNRDDKGRLNVSMKALLPRPEAIDSEDDNHA